MSGPKTSELEIQQRIQQQLTALRDQVDRAVARTYREIDAGAEEVRRLASSLGEAGADLVRESDEAAARAKARLRSECAYAPTSSMAVSEAAAQRAVDRAQEIRESFAAEIARVRETAKRLADRHDEAAGTADFAALLRQMAAREAEVNARGADAETAVEQRFDAGAEGDAWSTAGEDKEAPDIDASGRETRKGARFFDSRAAAEGALDVEGAACGEGEAIDLQAVAQRAYDLVRNPFALETDRVVLLRHGANLTEATAGSLALLLPAMERNAQAMEELAAQVKAVRAGLPAGSPAADAAPHVRFATLEEASEELERLRDQRKQADDNAYLRACIDEVMARRGYDICRSVTMGRDLMGAHSLYGADDSRSGLHVFVSDQGDMMIQVAGLPDGIEAVSEQAAVAYEPAQEGPRAAELLQAQTDFCAVYDEIAEELADYGITNKVRYRAEPGVAFSRELRMTEEGGRASDRPAKTRLTGEERANRPERRRRRGSEPAARAMR